MYMSDMFKRQFFVAGSKTQHLPIPAAWSWSSRDQPIGI